MSQASASDIRAYKILVRLRFNTKTIAHNFSGERKPQFSEILIGAILLCFIKTKFMKCCANICFNRQCLIRKVIPNYANFKIPNTSPASQVALKEAHIIRIKYETKFL
jgi:hypothetical protein